MLVAEGDFRQLPPPIQNCEDEDIRRSKFFDAQAVFQLRRQHRCLDPDFHIFQEEVRLSKPSEESLWNALGVVPFSTDVSEKY